MYASISRSEMQPKLQRLSGAARVGFSGPESGLTELYQSNPCRVLLPRHGDGPVEAVLLNTAGGITDGDELGYSIQATNGAHVLATTQAAEKVYQSRGDDAEVHCHLHLEDNATLEWLPQETILFDRAALARKPDIVMDGNSRLLAMDWLLLGRLARGETLQAASVHDRWRLRRDGRLIWADDFRLTGDIESLRQRPALLAGARAMATLIYAAPDAGAQVKTAKRLIENCQGRAGVSDRPGLLLCRFMARDGLTLRRDVEGFLSPFRAAIHGRTLPLPRVWSC
ncbi:MAG: urease accessory protein [Rhodospirillaceae bacterium]|nr:urease accessory protein [Rhodospirillaceae bacterium]